MGSVRTDPARSTSVSCERLRSPFGFSADGRTVLRMFTQSSE